MRIPFSNNQLMKIGSVGAVFVIGNALLMRWLTQKRFKQSPYFLQAQDTVLANRPLLDLLGEPLGFGSVDLDDGKNYSTASEANFQIPMKGSKTHGMLYLTAVRSEDGQRSFGSEKSNNDTQLSSHSDSKSNPAGSLLSGWKLKSLEVTVKDRPNQKLILVKDPNEKLPSESFT